MLKTALKYDKPRSAKRICALVSLAALLCAFVLSSCGEKKDPYAEITLDPAVFAEEISIAGSFDDVLVRISDNAAAALYSFPGAKAVAAFAGSGATAEEIIIITADDSEGAAELARLLKSRLAVKKLDFTDYNPAELPKIDGATVMSAGKYAIYCVSADYEATKAAIIGLLDEKMKG